MIGDSLLWISVEVAVLLMKYNVHYIDLSFTSWLVHSGLAGLVRTGVCNVFCIPSNANVREVRCVLHSS